MFPLLKITTKHSKWIWLVGSIVCIINALAPAATTVLIGMIFDAVEEYLSGISSQHVFCQKTLKICTGIFCLACINLVCDSIAGSIWRYEGFNCGNQLRLNIFKSYCDGDMAWMDSNQNSAGVSAQAFEDIKRIEMALGVGIASAIETVVSIVSCYGTALYYSWSVTLVCMAGFPFIVAIMAATSPTVARKMAIRKSNEDECSDRLHFIFTALSTVKIFSKEKHEQLRSHKYFKTIYRAELQAWNANTIQASVARFLSLAVFVQGFYFGHYMVTKHGLASGSVMAAFWACISGSSCVQQISSILMIFSEGTVSAKRLAKLTEHDKKEVLKKKIGLLPPPSAIPMDIKFSGVVFSYPTRGSLVLRGLDLQLDAGKTHYIVGPSGCGKSSLAAILLKEYELQAGTVHIGGNLLETAAPTWVYENITLVEQSAGLFDLSISDNLKLGARNPDSVSDDLIQSALHEFNAEFVYQLPQGVHTPGSYPLSGGQRQRLQLAKAWINNAPIMIFDESTSALDQELGADAMAAIRDFRRGKTTIIITHNLDSVPEGEPLYMIEDGFARKLVDWKCPDKEKMTPVSSIASAETMYEDLKCDVVSNIVSLPPDDETKSFLWAFVRSIPNKWLLALGGFGVVCQAVLTPVFSYAFSHLLVGILPLQDVNVTFWALIILLVAFLSAVAGYSTMLLQYCASRWSLVMRDKLLDKLLYSNSYLPSERTYYRKLLIGDVFMSRTIITFCWSSVVNLVVLGTIGLTWSIVEGWKLSLLGLCLAPLVAAATYTCNRVNRVWFGHVEASTVKIRRTLEQVVMGMRSLKSQHMESYFRDEYEAQANLLFKVSIRAGIYTSICDGVLNTFTPLAQGLLLYYGMHLISTAEYTVERTMTVFSLLVFSLVSLDGLARAIQQCGNAFEAMPRVMRAFEDTMSSPVDCVGYEAPTSEIDWSKIEFSNISMQGTALAGLNLTVQPGITAIVGTTGAGKSTLMRCLLKLQRPQTGAVFIDGVDIEKIPREVLRAQTAVVPQMPVQFFPGTVYENLIYGKEVSDSKLRETCARVNLHNFISSLEHGYETHIKDGLLSGGQMQRLAIARALLVEAPILILDEPTSTLDSENSALVHQVLRECCEQGTTVLVVTHQIEMMQRADHVINISAPN